MIKLEGHHSRVHTTSKHLPFQQFFGQSIDMLLAIRLIVFCGIGQYLFFPPNQQSGELLVQLTTSIHTIGRPPTMRTDPHFTRLQDIIQFASPIFEREYNRVKRQNVRAHKKGVTATLTFRQWLIILHAYQWKCAHCKGMFDTMEHLTPISQGGGTTAKNCVPLCAQCNSDRNKEYCWEGSMRHKLKGLICNDF